MVSGPTRPALKKRFDDRRSQIVDVCAQVFAEHGYDGAGIEELCAATGLTAGGLYHYIGSKRGALFAVLENLMDPLLEEAVEIAEGDGSAAQRCEALIVRWVEYVVRHRYHMLVFSQERHHLERDRREWTVIRNSRRKFEDLLAGLLREMRGGSGSDPDARSDQLLLYALLGMVNYIPTWYKPKGPLSPTQIASEFFEIVKRSIETAALPDPGAATVARSPRGSGDRGSTGDAH